MENRKRDKSPGEMKIQMEKDRELILVDDDEITMFIHQAILEDFKTVPVSTFFTARSAIDYLSSPKQEEKKFLILLDINMPVMNGWDMLEALRFHTLSNSISVIIVSSSSNASDIEQCKQHEMVIGYLIKPLSQEKLLSMISEESIITQFLYPNQ